MTHNFEYENNNNDNKKIYNNGESSPVIISAECRVKGSVGKLQYYNPLIGSISNIPYRVTIHNYESEALGYDPTIKSEQNYYRFLHLSTLLNFPWGNSIKFKDDDGVVFETSDIIRLLEERSGEVMAKWEIEQSKFKKLQDQTAEKIQNEIEFGVVKTVKFDKKKSNKLVNKSLSKNENIMII